MHHTYIYVYIDTSIDTYIYIYKYTQIYQEIPLSNYSLLGAEIARARKRF